MNTPTRVLIVEDEQMLAENIRDYLQRCGGEVQVALTGQQAIAAAKTFQPQVVLLDYHLPDMDGFEILDAIRVEQPTCACVLMTGHPLESVAAEAKRHAVEHILSKPFALADVVSSLGTALSMVPRPGATPTAQERRANDRRAEFYCVFIAIRLSDGSLLTHDRRVSNRRG